MELIQRIVCRHGLLQWILAIAFVLPAAYCLPVFAGKESSPQPLWEIDLSKFDYQSRSRQSNERTHWWRNRQSLVFTQENVLATTFQVHIENSGPSVRDKTLPTDPYHLVALFLDAGRGEVIEKGDWPVKSSDRTWFFPAQHGEFILGIADRLSLYSPDLSVVTERTLEAGYGQFITAMPSPAADTFLVLYSGGAEFKYAWKLDLLDTTHLSTVNSWTGDQAHPPWIVWGTELARISEHDIRIETPNSEPKQVHSTIEKYCGYHGFINQETLAVGKFGKGGCNTVAVMSTDGNILQELHFDSRGLVGAAQASRNGKFFAINGYASQRKPWKPYVMVFRLGSEKPLLTVDIPPESDLSEVSFGMLGDPTMEWGGVAISPDGDLLAVRAGPIVRVYRVPAPPQE
jgi:hypothetical protein